MLLFAGLALWVGLCTSGSALHRNAQSYVYVLAGYTACMIVLPAIEQPTPEKVGRKLADLMLGVLQGIEPARLQAEWQPVLHAGNSDGPAPR